MTLAESIGLALFLAYYSHEAGKLVSTPSAEYDTCKDEVNAKLMNAGES